MTQLRVLGFDPGLTETAWSVVRVPLADRQARPVLEAHGTIPTPEHDTAALRDALIGLNAQLTQRGKPIPPHVAVVESARGFIVKGRAADPVLRDAAQGGRLVGMLAALLPIPVLEMPALGLHQGYNWRALLGAENHTDDGLRVHISLLLGTPLPPGTHVVDATGIALATAGRLASRAPAHLPSAGELRAAFYRLSPGEQRVLDGLKDARAARKATRAGKNTVTTLGHTIDPDVLKPRRAARPRRKRP